MTALMLYHGEPNGPSLTVLAALFESGLDAELRYIDLLAGDRHNGSVPAAREVEMSIEGEAPVLVADGIAMADSVFIGCAIDEMAGGGKLVPADPYARWEMMTWCRWVIERVAPAAALIGAQAHAAPRLAAMAASDFDTMVSHIGSVDLHDRWCMTRADAFPASQIADSHAKIDAAVAKIEKQLEGRDWLMHDFTLADLESYAWLAGMPALVPLAFTHAPRTRAWMARVAARPSVAKALSLATVPDPRKAWAPGPEINRWG
jgi:GSH-dependent disulfide-bond oxidoreductase